MTWGGGPTRRGPGRRRSRGDRRALRRRIGPARRTPAARCQPGQDRQAAALKRPALFPVLDRELRWLYDTRAKEQARRPELTFRRYKQVYWEAVRTDLVAWREAGAFATLRGELTHDETRSGWAQLTDLRLLDITAWSYGKRRTQAG